MLTIIINLLGAIAAILTATVAIAAFLQDFWFGEEKRQEFKTRYENWWLKVADLDRQHLALALANKVSQTMDLFFGQRLFSKRALWRTFTCSTLLLIFSMTLKGISSGEFLGYEPWTVYRKTFDELKPITKKQIDTAKTEDERKSLEELNKYLNQFGTNTWAFIYSVIYFTLFFISSGLLCFFSLAFSRLVLREIIFAGRLFTTVILLLVNVFLVTLLSSFFLVFLVVLADPWLWIVVVFCLLLSLASFWVGIAITFMASVAALAFALATLKIVAIIAFLPLIVTIFVLTFTVVTLKWRDAYKTLLLAVLLKCAELGPAKVVAGAFGAAAGIVALIQLIV